MYLVTNWLAFDKNPLGLYNFVPQQFPLNANTRIT